MAYLKAISYEEARLAFFKVALARAERSLDWAVEHIAELTLRSGADCDVCEEKGDIVSYYKDVVAMLERGVDKGEFVSRKAMLEAFENANADVVEEYEDGTRDWGFGMRNIREIIAGVPAADVELVRRRKLVWLFKNALAAYRSMDDAAMTEEEFLADFILRDVTVDLEREEHT